LVSDCWAAGCYGIVQRLHGTATFCHELDAMNSGPNNAGRLIAEAERILDAAKAAPNLRLTGSVAVQMRCPRFGRLARNGREIRDIDFAGYKRELKAVQQALGLLGYAEDREVAVVSEGSRAIFEHPESRLHLDVFYDRLDFCHVIPLAGRLEADRRTLPLAELVLGKLQIVKINEKDLADLMALLLEHPLGERDEDAINMARIARLSAEDWGLWRTATFNLEKLGKLVATHDALGQAERQHLAAQLGALTQRLESEPKPLAWRMRAKLGERVKWYRDVDEVR
jgi:hypothetical protein